MELNVRPSPDTVAQRVGDEIVLVHLKTDRIFALSPTAARIWDLLCEKRDWSAIQEILLAEFDVTEAQLEDEVFGLVAQLEKERFIEPDG